jgi:hypothetical protein
MTAPWWKPLLAAAALAAGIAAWLFFFHWTPEAQVKRHQKAFFRAIESANWTKLEALLDPGYQDEWGLSREQIADLISEGRAQFLFLEIDSQKAEVNAGSGAATYRAVLRISGSGHALAQQAQQRFNRIDTPFLFTWRKSGPKPWDWLLISVSNPDIHPRDFPGSSDLLDF